MSAFDDNFKDFDKSFNRIQNFAIGWIVFCAFMSLLIMFFVFFVVYKVMQHFGVL